MSMSTMDANTPPVERRRSRWYVSFGNSMNRLIDKIFALAHSSSLSGSLRLRQIKADKKPTELRAQEEESLPQVFIPGNRS